jgi:hypothetical protein
MKPTDSLFILCLDNRCFMEHEFDKLVEKVYLCVKLKDILRVNWD